MQHPPAHRNIVVATFYRFVRLEAIATLRARMLHAAEGLDLRGTILLAEEGINGTISGPREAIGAMFECLHREPPFHGLGRRESLHDEHPFGRFKIKLKKEIVTLGVPKLDPAHDTGERVDPTAWNELIGRPEVVLIDTRNRYEVHLGTFEGAIDPDTDSFRDFPAWVEANLDPERDREVAMFCTGGIRCEKASAYLQSQGFERVYQLEGGVLSYLETIPAEQSRWRGECFVFDERASVDHELDAVRHELCPNCRIPILPGEKALPGYEENVSCIHCVERTTERRRASLAERQRQAAFARQRSQDGAVRNEAARSGDADS